MEIKYLGHSSFLLKGSQGRVVTDPYDPAMLGKKFPKVEAEIVTISHQHQDHNAGNLVGGGPLVLKLPGEYEKSGIRVFGYESFHDSKQGAERGKNILFKIEIDDIAVLHCGDLGHMLSDETIEEIEQVDVLLIPVGGFYTISAEEATQVVSKLEPAYVIPMHYNVPGFSQDLMSKLAPVSDFLQKIGATETVLIDKLIIKKQDIGEDMKVVVLSS